MDEGIGRYLRIRRGGGRRSTATDEITWSEEVYRIFELDPAVPVTAEQIVSRVHPEDAPLLYEMIDRARGWVSSLRAADRLFEAFYTTKSDGMGIGLSVSGSIIESHHGRLWAATNEGPGATFSFSIPRAPEGAAGDPSLGAIRTPALTDAKRVVKGHGAGGLRPVE